MHACSGPRKKQTKNANVVPMWKACKLSSAHETLTCRTLEVHGRQGSTINAHSVLASQLFQYITFRVHEVQLFLFVCRPSLLFDSADQTKGYRRKKLNQVDARKSCAVLLEDQRREVPTSSYFRDS